MGIRGILRTAAERLIARFGYELKIVGSPPSGYSGFLRRMVEAGVQPRTVFDIGVGNGTPWLYEAFPQAHFVLIEPQREFEPELQEICRRIDAEYHLVGVGSKEQHLPIYRLLSSPTGSSFLPPNAENEQRWGASEKSGEIHVVPLDTYRELQGPFFVKIDTEGFELEVLRGAVKILEQTDVVLMEVAILKRQEGEPDLIEIGAFMKSNGFRLIDFPVLTQQKTGGPLLYVDVAFARSEQL
ncbi:FkbM family methyltransferase [Rhodanobacter terrae]|uniref:FkbM family methyltransferase n=1 Tax=Rhodanobacter terrae TaxID=418647 RepID=A0ABW0T1T0_9GAMM